MQKKRLFSLSPNLFFFDNFIIDHRTSQNEMNMKTTTFQSEVGYYFQIEIMGQRLHYKWLMN